MIMIRIIKLDAKLSMAIFYFELASFWYVPIAISVFRSKEKKFKNRGAESECNIQ